MAINIGDIVFGLGPDTSRLRSAVNDMHRFGDALDKVAQSQEDGANKQAAAMMKQERAMAAAMQRTQDMNSRVRSQMGGSDPMIGSKAADALSMSSLAARDFTNEMARLNITQLDSLRAAEANAAMMGRARREMREYQTDVGLAAKASQDFNNALLRQESALSKASTQFANFNQKAQLSGGNNAAIDQATQAMQRFETAMRTGALSSAQFLQSQDRFTADMANANRMLSEQAAKMKADAEAAKQLETALKGASNIMAQLARQQLATNSGSDKLANFTQRVQLGGGSPEAITAATKAFQEFQNTMNSGAQSQIRFTAAQQQFNSGMANASRILREHQTAVRDGHVEGNRFQNFMNNMATAAQLSTGPLGGLAFRITTLANLFERGSLAAGVFVASLAGIGFAAFKFSEGAVQQELKLLAIREQLQSLSGSSAQMRQDLQRVMDVSNKFGISFTGVVDNFREFVLAARGTSIEGEKVKRLFEDIIAIGGKLSLDPKNLEQFLDFTSRSISKGAMDFGEVRRTLNRIIPNAEETMQRALGMNADTIKRAFDRGQIIAAQHMPKFIAQIHKDFNIDRNEPVTNLRASLNKLQNEWMKFVNAVDATMGFSESTQTWADRIAKGLELVRTNIVTTTAAMGGFVTALALVFAGPLLGSALFTAARGVALLAGGFVGLTSVIVSGGLLGGLAAIRNLIFGISLATLATPIGWIIRLGIAVAGGYAAFQTLNGTLETNKDKLIDAGNEMDTYIKSLEDSVKKTKTLNDETAKLNVARQQDVLNKAQTAREAAEKAVRDTEIKITELMTKLKDTAVASSDVAIEEFAKNWSKRVAEGKIGPMQGEANSVRQGPDGAKATAQMQMGLKGLQEELQNYRTQLETTGKLEQQEYDRMIKLSKALDNVRKNEKEGVDDVEKKRALTRKEQAEKDVRELSEGFEKEFEAMKKGPRALADVLHEVEIDKELRRMNKSLLEAGLSAGEAAPHMERYSAALRKLKDAQKFDKDFVSIGKFLGDSFREAATTGVNQFVDALYRGELHMLKLGDIARTVLASITKKFLELAFINPLMNSLFGTTAQVLSFGAGGTGTGGLFGGLNLKHGGSGISAWRLGVNPGIFAGAPKLHGGLMPGEFPAILEQGEAVIPKGAMGAAPSYHLESHVHYAGPPPEDQGKQKDIADSSRRALESMMDARIANARRPGGIMYGGR